MIAQLYLYAILVMHEIQMSHNEASIHDKLFQVKVYC